MITSGFMTQWHILHSYLMAGTFSTIKSCLRSVLISTQLAKLPCSTLLRGKVIGFRPVLIAGCDKKFGENILKRTPGIIAHHFIRLWHTDQKSINNQTFSETEVKVINIENLHRYSSIQRRAAYRPFTLRHFQTRLS
ncbi:protein of unknown function [Brevefilum fermentans]|uniref:Uncharacterized protein n=1 Tax=Candidatus Brevifilum fermentans TaxID=1986204 RepID=A0A1Y6K3G4_9CHLR|nr:protein of unknown function [Brevefilum fermentans]